MQEITLTRPQEMMLDALRHKRLSDAALQIACGAQWRKVSAALQKKGLTRRYASEKNRWGLTRLGRKVADRLYRELLEAEPDFEGA